jgi:iron(II)-dependent oxidoreductase
LDAFWLKQTEVTNAEYVRCVNDNRACSEPASPRWNDPVFANYPVTGVDWYQVMQYARWAGGRLPTEAEWEKACRGADGRIYPWGDRAPTPDLANSNATDAKPVGSYPGGATPYGALDLAGNVAEWTSTQYRAYPYAADDGRENVEVEADRVLRGGSFATDVVRCAVRDYDGPNDRSNVIGFRVVLDK